jgi:hypothetical protein
VKKMLFVVALVAALACFAAAADLPPVHLGNQPHVGLKSHGAPGLSFCPSCLYYAGDLNSTDTSTENGLFNYDNPGIGISDAEVWTAVKPTKASTVTGTSTNELTTNTTVGTNPTPFTIEDKVKAGVGGTVTCKSSGTATEAAYAGADNSFGLDGENYYIKKLKTQCKLKKGTEYWLNLNPQYNDGSTIGYLADAEAPNKHHTGWKVVNGASYFNSASFGVTWENTSGSSGACGGIGCDAFSISVSGK